MKTTILTIVISTLLLACAALVGAEPFGSAFTYQGRLLDSNAPADGMYDIQFKLYDAPDNAVPVASPVYLNDVAVEDGYFIVELDFGAGAFDGQARWLQIAVRPGSSLDEHTVLTPMQPITPAPYAQYAGQSPGGSGVWATNADNIYNTNSGGVGTSDPVWELEVANPRAGEGAEVGVTANDASGAIAAYSGTLGAPFGHFAGRVSLFAGLETPGLDLRADGSIGDIRLYTGGVGAGSERMRITSNGAVGIGTSSPLSKFSVDNQGLGGINITSYRTDGLGSWQEGLFFTNNSNGMGPWTHAGIWTDGSSNYNGNLIFGVDGDDTNNLNGIQEAMRITKDGNVVIGDSSNNNHANDRGDLYVEDDLEVDGTIYANNMPGCNYSDPTNQTDITSRTVVKELTFTPPDYGYIIVTVTGTAQLIHSDIVYVNIESPETLVRNTTQISSAYDSLYAMHSFSVQWATNIGSGVGNQWHFYAVVTPYGMEPNPSADIIDLVMTIIYVPVRYQ